MSFYNQPPPVFSNEPPPLDIADEDEDDFSDFQDGNTTMVTAPQTCQILPDLNEDTLTANIPSVQINAAHTIVDDPLTLTADAISPPSPEKVADPIAVHPEVSINSSSSPQLLPTIPPTAAVPDAVAVSTDDMSSGSASDVELSEAEEEYGDNNTKESKDEVDQTTNHLVEEIWNPVQLGDYISSVVESLPTDPAHPPHSPKPKLHDEGEVDGFPAQDDICPPPAVDEDAKSDLEDNDSDWAQFTAPSATAMKTNLGESPEEIKENGAQDDFADFADFSLPPQPSNTVPATEKVSEGDEDEFGDFADFTSRDSIDKKDVPPMVTSGRSEDSFEEDEFADFATADATSAPKVNINAPLPTPNPHIETLLPRDTLLDRLVDKISPLMTTCFSQQDFPLDPKTHKANNADQSEHRCIPHMDQHCKDLLAYLEDFEKSRSVKYQWNESESYRDFLQLSHVDYESLVKSRQPVLPAFACHMATSGGGILEPQKVVGLSSGASSMKAGSPGKMTPPPIPSNEGTTSNPPTGVMDVAEFDWGSSGLVNPLQSGLDTELLSNADATGLAQCFQPSGPALSGDSGSPTVKRAVGSASPTNLSKSSSQGNLKTTPGSALHRLLMTSKQPSPSASASSSPAPPRQQQILAVSNLHPGKGVEELSEPARDIVLRLPRIATYMNAKVIMFPILTDTNGEAHPDE